MGKTVFDLEKCDIAWCPGCGNYGILNLVKEVVSELALDPQKLVFVSGIGQAAKLPQYLKCHYYNGLHGRALSPAVAIKMTNPELTVIVTSGDGDMYGEGGNHFLHTIRRNPNITNLVHNNMVYGLTKGQASPTSEKGFKTPVQVDGVILEPFNPLAVAIALDASFVARVFIGFREHAKEIIKKAILHKGYALVDIFQPCVTFNKINTYQWFRENTYLLDDSHDPRDRTRAFQKAIENKKMPLGIFFVNEKAVFEEQLAAYKQDRTPVCQRAFQPEPIEAIIKKLKE
ncbi:MAG TPA: thiamine pyrophosphate-dependent enzyme [Candidatus Omnitrophota bacterium]|nr:thiamine pyrophosphate-dependent enzyme [Candidatus Omnitrophota bacterium]HRY85706.1 thiamine pyrophosphate-dependent enzyme [Candidatus Omnitrophota bacterium]